MRTHLFVAAVAAVGVSGLGSSLSAGVAEGVAKTPPPSEIAALAFSPDASLAVSGTSEGEVCLWDVETGTPVRRFERLLDRVTSMAFSPDGRQIAAAGRIFRQYFVLICDVENPEQRWLLAADRAVTVVGFAAAGRLFAATEGGEVWVWDATGEVVATIDADEPIAAVALSGDSVLAVSAWGVVRQWELADGRETRRFELLPEAIGTAAFSRDARQLLVSVWSGDEPCVLLYDVAEGELIASAAADAHRMAFVPGSCHALFGRRFGEDALRLWDLGEAAIVRTLPADEVSALAISCDGRYVLSGGQWAPEFETADGEIRLWDLETGEEVRRFGG